MPVNCGLAVVIGCRNDEVTGTEPRRTAPLFRAHRQAADTSQQFGAPEFCCVAVGVRLLTVPILGAVGIGFLSRRWLRVALGP
jgi:hypothetical protein